MDGFDGIEVGPVVGPADAAVIWMHGLGADASDFPPIVPHLHLPRARFVFPNAPRIPVTINGGYVMRAWYDIRTFELVPDRENGAQIRASAQAIRDLVARENDRGIPTDRIVLAGFSQGAAMALFTGMRLDARLAGIAVLSGYLVLEDTLAAERHAANAATPVFFGHGTQDDVVLPDRGRHAYEAVRHGRVASWNSYGMGHAVSPAEIADLRQWFHGIVG